MSWIDTHTHLEQIGDDGLSAVLERAQIAQVEMIVTVGMDLATSAAAVRLANHVPEIRPAVGIHPWNAEVQGADDVIGEIQEFAETHDVVGIGEIGLDYENNLFTGVSYHSEQSRQRQRDLFRRQLGIARALHLPAIIHSRGGAHADVANIVAECLSPGQAVIQFLTGAPRDVAAYLELGCYLSIGGPVADPRDPLLRQAVATIPLDKLVLETDTPYVPPLWKWQLPSEPADLPAIAAYAAAILDVPLTALRQATTRNARSLFNFS